MTWRILVDSCQAQERTLPLCSDTAGVHGHDPVALARGIDLTGLSLSSCRVLDDDVDVNKDIMRDDECREGDTEYDIMLRKRKRQWKRLLESHKRRRSTTDLLDNEQSLSTSEHRSRLDSGNDKNVGGGSGSGSSFGQVSQYFQRQATTLLASRWEIVQIIETDTPGLLVAWSLVNGRRLYPIKITVPKVFYVHTCLPDVLKVRF